MDSPFKAATLQKFPDHDLRGGKRFSLRVESGGTFKVLLAINRDASTTSADYFLDSGEALELTSDDVLNIGSITVLSVTGNPNIYWFVR